MNQTVKASEVRDNWSDVLNKVFRKQARFVVEKSGIPVAAIISTDDLERLKRFEEERARDFAILDEIGAAFKDVPAEELERETARAIAEARAEIRQKKEAQQP